MIAGMRRLACVAALAMSLLPMVVAHAQSPMASTAPRSAAPDVIGEVSVVVVLLHRADGAALTPEDLAATAKVMEARLAALPAPGSTVTPIAPDRVRIDVGDPSQLESIRRVATAPGELLFVPIPPEFAMQVESGARLPLGMPVEPIFDAGHVEEAVVGMDAMGYPAVDLQLDAEAAALFDAHAASHQGEMFAMVLDGVVLSAPRITETEFRGRARISGSFGEQAVSELVAVLSGGVLPAVAELLTVCPAPAPCPVTSPDPGSTPSP